MLITGQNTVHSSTEFSPYYLMFVHKPRLSILQTEVDPHIVRTGKI